MISYNSKIFIATDDQDYANQIKKLFLNEKFFDRELLVQIILILVTIFYVQLSIFEEL